MSVFGAIVTEALRSCVLNPNVRVGSRSRYPKLQPSRHCKTHTRNDALEKSHCGLYLAATVHFLRPPCMPNSPGHSNCSVDDQFRRPTSGWVEPQIDARFFFFFFFIFFSSLSPSLSLLVSLAGCLCHYTCCSNQPTSHRKRNAIMPGKEEGTLCNCSYTGYRNTSAP